MNGTSGFFQVNERVSFLYEKGEGIVCAIEPSGLYIVEDTDGFIRKFRQEELVKIHGFEYHLPDESVSQINEDDSISKDRHTEKKGKLTGSRKPVDVWEIDLHIESILETHAGMSNAEILTVQLRELRTFYKRATSKYIRKLVIIHGVGEGVLKEEVCYFLAKKEGVEFYDADFREYGKGATAVEIHYNIH